MSKAVRQNSAAVLYDCVRDLTVRIKTKNGKDRYSDPPAGSLRESSRLQNICLFSLSYFLSVLSVAAHAACTEILYGLRHALYDLIRFLFRIIASE